MLSLFLFTILLVAFFRAFNNLTPYDALDYRTVKQEAAHISNRILTTGLPADWNISTVLTIGIKKQNKEVLSKYKLYEAEQFSYNELKNKLGATHEFVLLFKNSSDSLVNFGGYCYLGFPLSIVANNFVAYYYNNSYTNYIYRNMTNLGADIYSVADVDDFFDNLNNYTLLVLENPRFDDSGSYSLTEKRDMLENFVKHHGSIVLSGYTGVNMFNVSFTMVNSEFYNINSKREPFLLDAGLVNFSSEYGINYTSSTSITPIAINSKNLSAIASWDFGNGSIVYIANFTAHYNSTNQPLNKWFVYGIRNLIAGNCSRFDYNIDTEHMVSVKRLVSLENTPVTMEVISWI